MGKLETLMKKRANDRVEAELAAKKAKAKREEEERERHTTYYKAEFKKRFAELRELVDGEWDENDWGWKFQCEGKDYWISYDHYFHEGWGADDYDTEGYYWVLKSQFNASADGVYGYTLYSERDDDPLTNKVIEGLEFFNNRNRIW